MNTLSGKIALLVLILAVLVYVVYNYVAGNSQLDYFVVSCGLLCFFLLQVGANVIRDLRDRNQ